ncbi:MAG: hypothetical protein HY909_11945 [Deltaproteobacteria bacterium]|nr:hypothetical protein [Deltaproteobacteria bacterium]
MQGSEFDQAGFFAAIAASGARALMIGRRAMIALGLSVMTQDYDFWVHGDDIDAFNAAVEPFGLFPNRDAAAARAFGRYVLENDERVDVLVSRSVPTVDGVRVAFDDLWTRKQEVSLGYQLSLCLPSIDDLILTKLFGGRPKDAEDIRQLLALKGTRP